MTDMIYDDYGIVSWLESTASSSTDDLCEGLAEIRKRLMLGPLRHANASANANQNQNSTNSTNSANDGSSSSSSSQKYSSFRYFAPFFVHIRKAFARYRHEGNTKILQLLTGIVSDSISFIQDRAIQLQPLIPDLIFNLMDESLQRSTEELLMRLSDEEDCLEMIQSEMEIAILNSNNKKFIEIINSFSNRSPYGNKQRTRKMSITGSSDASKQFEDKNGLNDFRLNFSNNDRKLYAEESLSPRVMEISFLPHSITEQWLLAKSITELTVVLDDIMCLYDSLPILAREKTKQDLPKLLRHISQNLACDIFEVTIQCIKLLHMIAKDNVDYFGPHLHTIFPHLIKGLDDSKEQLRSSSLRFICYLVTNISFCLTTKWILSVLDFKKRKYENYPLDALKVASLGILKCTQESGSVLVGSDRISLLRISTAAASYLVEHLNNCKRGESNDLALDIIASSMALLFPSSSATQETVFLKFLDMIVPENSQKLDRDIQNSILARATTGISNFSSLRKDQNIADILKTVLKEGSSFSSSLPTYEDLAVTDSFSLLSPFEDDDPFDSTDNYNTDPAEMFNPNEFKRSSYTEMANKSNSNDEAEAITAQRKITAPASPVKENTKNTDIGTTEYRDNAKDAEDDDSLAKTLSYVPSWSKNLNLESTINVWGDEDPLNASSDKSVDRSKLTALKTSTKKPHSSSRRAHSAEVTKVDNFGDLGTERITSFTSDGSTTRDLSGTKKLVVDDTDSESNLRNIGKLFNSFQPVPSFLEENERMNRLRESFMDKVKMQLLEAASSGDKEKDKEKPKKVKNKRRQGNSTAAAATLDEKAKEEIEPMPSIDTSSFKQTIIERNSELIKSPRKVDAEKNSGIKSKRVAKNNEAKETISAMALVEPVNESSGPPIDLFDRPIRPMKIDTSFDLVSDEYYSATSLLATPISTKTPTKRVSQSDRIDKERDSGPIRSPRQLSPRRDRDDAGKKNSASPKDNSGLKVESFDYLTTEEIEPSPNPSKDLSKVILGLEKDDWPEIFHTLTSLRRLGLHHPNIVHSSGSLHSIIVGVLKQVDNLRSAVAKNAILTIGDLFQGMGQRMDAEVPNTINSLLKRCGDTSNFLNDVADNAILQMNDNVTPSRSLSSLLTGTSHKNAVVRGKVASFISYLLTKKANELRGSKEIEELKSRLSKMLGDSTPEARSSTRSVIRALLDQSLASHYELEQILTAATLKKALTLSSTPTPSPRRVIRKEFISPVASEKSQTSFMKPSPLFMPDYNQIASGNASDDGTANDDDDDLSNVVVKKAAKNVVVTPSRAKSVQAKKLMQTSEDLQHLPQIIAALESNEWNSRKDALTQLSDILLSHSSAIKDSGKLDYYMDRLYERLEDGSLKIQLHALSCIQKLHKQIPSILNVTFALPALLNVASFSNKQISSSGSMFLDEYIVSLPLPIVVNQLCQVALYEKERLKVKAFKVLGSLNLVSSPDGTVIAKKQLVPTICQALFNNTSKGDIRVAAIDALKCLSQELESSGSGEKIYQWVEAKHIEEVKKLLNKL